MSSTQTKDSDDIAAERLIEMTQYQEGSVVSRVILKREHGNVTMFAFDKGQGLSEHTSPYDALVQAIDGEAEITVSGKRYALNVGDVVLLPAGQPHAVMPVSRFKMLLTMIRS